jgi:hypothetical protein
MIVLLAVSLGTAYAGNEDRIGTSGAQELLIPVGSRGTALSGSIVATTSGVEAMYWNPAGLASITGTQAMFSHQPYIADIDINFAGVATTIEDFGTIGFGAKVVSVGDIEETTEEYPDGTGRDFAPTFTVLNMTYAKVLTSNVSFGATMMFIRESIAEMDASGMAFDVGFIYTPNWRGMKVGLAIKNYGQEMAFSGIGSYTSADGGHAAEPISAKFDLPSSINMGIAYDLFDQDRNLATLSGNFQSNNYYTDAWMGGLEYTYDGKYSLRAGYSTSEEEHYLYGLTFGGGVNVDLGGTNLTLEYAWSQTEVFDDNQYFTLTANF